MIHAVSSKRGSLTRRLPPPGGQCGNLTGTSCKSVWSHAHTHTKQHVCLLKNMFPCCCVVLLMLPVSGTASPCSLHPSPSLPQPPSPPAPLPSLGMAQHSPTFRPALVRLMNSIHQSPVPFDRCKSAVPLLRSPHAALWPQTRPRRAAELHVQTKPERVAREKEACARNDASSAPGLVTAVMDGVEERGGDVHQKTPCMWTVRAGGLRLNCTVVSLCRGRGRLNDACRLGKPRNFSPSCCSHAQMGAEETREKRSMTNCRAAQGIGTGGGRGLGGTRRRVLSEGIDPLTR